MPDAHSPLPDWLNWLETLSPLEIDLGLDRVRAVFERLQMSQPRHLLIVGGTNGKGSSVAMAEALLREAGLCTGAYTSPHIHRYNERICVNGVPVDDDAIVEAFCAVEAVRDGLPLTYFEFGTLAALYVFAKADTDVWILEVGLGGRLDATNVVEPDASLITNVSLDHCDWLGGDIETIATEKAGIMRAGKPTVYADADVPDAILKHARDIGAGLVFPDTLDIPDLALRGTFQKRNAAGVLALLNAAGLSNATTQEAIDKVLPGVEVDGRGQTMDEDGLQWFFDVAHNPAAANALAGMLAEDVRSTTAIVGILDDKDVAGLIAPLAPHVKRWIAVTADSRRAIPADELARQIANLCDSACLTATSYEEAVQFARRCSDENDRILVTGSFFTVGPVQQILEFRNR